MRLSLSIQMDVLKAKAGSILNTFKIFPRRDVLFFEDILAQYIRECEKAGFGEDLYNIGKKWSAIEVNFIPKLMRSIAPESIINNSIKHVWTNLGLADDFNLEHLGDTYVFSTKNEFITRIIGANSFMRGGSAGAAAGFHLRDAFCKDCVQTKGSCTYTIELLDRPFGAATKQLEVYNHMNAVPKTEGVSLKKALLSGFFRLNGSRITFRGKTMLCLENSGFHILGASGILLDHLSAVTTSFFSGLVEPDATSTKKLSLLAALLQACGWGSATIEVDDKGGILFYVWYPPYGLQIDEDNWDFLAHFILGYLHLINKKIVLKETALRDGRLLLRYSGL